MTNALNYPAGAANSSREWTVSDNYRRPAWSPAMIEKLRELWPGDLSATLIAEQLRVTKNAVIGKAHRLGLQARAKGGPRITKPRKYKLRRFVMPKLKSEPIEPPPAPALPSSNPVDMAGLKGGMCRYVLDSGLFCGDKAEKSYCAVHARIVYGRP